MTSIQPSASASNSDTVMIRASGARPKSALSGTELFGDVKVTRQH